MNRFSVAHSRTIDDHNPTWHSAIAQQKVPDEHGRLVSKLGWALVLVDSIVTGTHFQLLRIPSHSSFALIHGRHLRSPLAIHAMLQMHSIAVIKSRRIPHHLDHRRFACRCCTFPNKLTHESIESFIPGVACGARIESGPSLLHSSCYNSSALGPVGIGL